ELAIENKGQICVIHIVHTPPPGGWCGLAFPVTYPRTYRGVAHASRRNGAAMPIVVLVLVLGAYVYALVSFPEFRWWGLAGGALAALGLGVYFWQATPETGRTGLRISADEI